MVLWVASLLALGLLIQGVKSSNIRIRRTSTAEESRRNNEIIEEYISKYQHPRSERLHARSFPEWYPPSYLNTRINHAYIEGISKPISSQEQQNFEGVKSQQSTWPNKAKAYHDFQNKNIDKSHLSNFNKIKELEEEDHLADNSVAIMNQKNLKKQKEMSETSKKSPWTELVQQTSDFRSSSDNVKMNSENSEPTALHHTQDQNDVLHKQNGFSDVYFVAIVAGCSAAAAFGVIAAGYCFYKIQKNSKAAAEVDYPAYGVTGPNKEHSSSPNGDRKLAQSAQMYHYQQQKQQMIAVEKASTTRQTSASDVDSEEENEEGDYTVYECPGLAPTGEMEVKNPLFNDESAPASPPIPPSRTIDK